jgi:hypothetical protein
LIAIFADSDRLKTIRFASVISFSRRPSSNPVYGAAIKNKTDRVDPVLRDRKKINFFSPKVLTRYFGYDSLISNCKFVGGGIDVMIHSIDKRDMIRAFCFNRRFARFFLPADCRNKTCESGDKK